MSDVKTCGRCKEIKPVGEFYRDRYRNDGLMNRCKACDSKHHSDSYMSDHEKRKQMKRDDYARNRLWYISYHKKYREKNLKASRARMLCALAIASGELKPQPCEECGKKLAINAHHDDYDKPLDVRWLCDKHHQSFHAALRAATQSKQNIVIETEYVSSREPV